MNAINQIINVDAFYFEEDKPTVSGRSSKRKAINQVKTYPRRIQFGNTQYTFNDGLQCLIRKGQRVVRLFDMTDGRTCFRLKLENDEWTLLGTRASQSNSSINNGFSQQARNINVSMGV